jgi:glucose-6-phosphate 1-dehydrogenase
MKNTWLFALLVASSGIALYWYGRQSVQSSYKQLSGWTIIIPGITGDLAKRKLIPALYRLYKKGMRSLIIGTGRRDAAINEIVLDAQKFVDSVDEQSWKQFSDLFVYHRLDPSNTEDFKALKHAITDYEAQKHLSGKRLVFLSLPPDVFCSVTQLLVNTNIIVRDKPHYMLYEKPFGWDLKSAENINACVTSLLTDRQLYRIDHYVAKGLTQLLPYLPAQLASLLPHKQTQRINTNLTYMPAAKNLLSDTVWDSTSIASVTILFHETLGIEGRGSFYDRYGAIKDVIQNHVLQLLAYFALDSSKAPTRAEKAEQKAAFLNSLVVQNVQRSQYEGYRAEKDVASDSKTETYAAVTLTSKDPRWKNVHFFLETGKALADKTTQLKVTFKGNGTNQLIVQFAPKELISVQFSSHDGHPFKAMKDDFHYPEAYEALLADVLTEQLRYSISFEEIKAQWRLADAMLTWPAQLNVYSKGFQAEV